MKGPIPMTAALPTNDHAAPATAAADLARSLHDSGWILTGAAVRTIHTACLTDASGLTVGVSSEAGQTSLDFESEYRAHRDTRRQAWYGHATRELPAEVLAAVASANAIAFDDDETEVGELLTAAGWSRPHPHDHQWTSPDQTREVVFIDDELEYTDLPWRIRWLTDRPAAVSASQDAPAQIIAAFALTDVP
jgi:hypothetical protein